MIANAWNGLCGGVKYAGSAVCNAAAYVAPKVKSAISGIAYPILHPLQTKKFLTELPEHCATAYKLYTDAQSVVDKTDGVQKLTTVGDNIKGAYHCVQPKVVELFHQRFGTDTMMDVASFSHLASIETKQQVEQKGFIATKALDVVGQDTLDVNIKTATLGAITWAANKIQAKIPDGDLEARSQLAAGIAQDLQKVVSEVESAAVKARENTGGNWGSKGFTQAFNDELAVGKLAKKQIGQKTFYKKLADRLIAKMEKELPDSLEPHQAEMLKTAMSYVSPETKREQLATLLMRLHKEATDPTRIKELLTKILDSSAKSMDEKFENYMKHLEPGPASSGDEKKYDKAYGQTVMSLLQAIQPHAFRLNIMALYACFHDKSMPEGEDFLSVILRDATGSSIESMMRDNSDEWLKSALKMARMKLLNAEDKLIARPGYISEDDWGRLNDEEKLQAQDISIGLGKELKNRQIKRVDAEFLKSSRAISKSALRAGLIAEQWIPTIKQIADDPKRSAFVRGLARILTYILALSGVKFLLDLLHRLNIYIRMGIASLASIRAGYSISSRVDELLHTNALDIMTMHMMERMMERLDLLEDTTQGNILAADDKKTTQPTEEKKKPKPVEEGATPAQSVNDESDWFSLNKLDEEAAADAPAEPKPPAALLPSTTPTEGYL